MFKVILMKVNYFKDIKIFIFNKYIWNYWYRKGNISNMWIEFLCCRGYKNCVMEIIMNKKGKL